MQQNIGTEDTKNAKLSLKGNPLSGEEMDQAKRGAEMMGARQRSEAPSDWAIPVMAPIAPGGADRAVMMKTILNPHPSPNERGMVIATTVAIIQRDEEAEGELLSDESASVMVRYRVKEGRTKEGIAHNSTAAGNKLSGPLRRWTSFGNMILAMRPLMLLRPTITATSSDLTPRPPLEIEATAHRGKISRKDISQKQMTM
jgi:hypothetical protein